MDNIETINTSNTIESVVEEKTEKAYTLRPVQAKDVFPMFRIISKIGIKEFKACMNSSEAIKIISESADDSDEAKNAARDAAGIQIIIEILGVISAHMSVAEQDIYQLLSQVSGMSKAEISELPLATFTEMIIELFKSDGFTDFIKVALRLFK